MPGNSFGKIFTVTTYGESHGRAVGVVIDGVPPGVDISEEYIQNELDRRRPGQSSITTSRDERDRVEILSGVFDGRTTGTPVSLLIWNKGMDSSAYESIKNLFRPGHADYGYFVKYGIRDWRGGGRASGRETAARVAAGAVAKKLLAEKGILITGYTREIGGIRAEKVDLDVIEANPVRSPDLKAAELMVKAIEKAREERDSLGGIVEVVAGGVPAGIGDPVFDKLEAVLAHGVMSIGAVKSFEIGVGINAARMRGSRYNDPFYSVGGRIRTRTNNAGGIIGGISTGENIIIRAAVRPTASISLKQKTVDTEGREAEIEVTGRHDPCIVPRIVPVVEAMVSITLIDCLLIQKIYES